MPFSKLMQMQAQAIPVLRSKPFWSFVNMADNEAELSIYGEIASSNWWGDEGVVTHTEFKKQLEALGPKSKITVRINSGGGDVYAAQSIYTLLRENAAKIIVKIDGIAASAATVIAMAADEIQIPASAYMMIHNPATFMYGYYQTVDITKVTSMLDVVTEGIQNVYMSRTKKTKDEIKQIMDDETWYTGEQAVAAGFADKLMFDDSKDSGSSITNSGVMQFAASFKKCPPQLLQAKPDPAVKDNKKPEVSEMEIKTVQDLRDQLPEMVKEIETGVRDQVLQEERTRIKAIDELAGQVDSDLLAEAKYTNIANAEQTALRAFKEGKLINSTYLNAAATDAAQANQVPGAANEPKDKATEAEAAIKHAKNIAESVIVTKKAR